MQKALQKAVPTKALVMSPPEPLDISTVFYICAMLTMVVKHEVYCIYCDYVCLFIAIINISLFFYLVLNDFNDLNQILTTLHQFKIQLNQVSALLINLTQIRDLF